MRYVEAMLNADLDALFFVLWYIETARLGLER